MPCRIVELHLTLDQKTGFRLSPGQPERKGKVRCVVTMAVSKTLVLNKEWRPINVLPVLKAVMKVFSGRALFIDPDTHRTFDFENWVLEWEDAVRTSKIASERVMPLAGWSLLLPEIVVCTEYRGFGYKVDRRKPKFSRRNLFLRDRCVCQFCGKKLPSDDLTMGHIVPKSKGGEASWTNIVLSCVPCNHKMADRTPKQAGMRLIREPFIPTADDLRITPADRIRMQVTSSPPKTWEQFLGRMYWNVELQD
jgi:5-methylcytosine-specific restriction endonuclease McrA